MKTNLAPWQELIIGIILLIIGIVVQNTASSFVGSLIFILANVIILIAVAHKVISLFTNKSLKVVRQTCSTMIDSFLMIKQKYPEADNEDIYEKILNARYQDGAIAMQVNAKAKQNVGPVYFKKYNLRAVTLAAIVYETGIKRSHFDQESKETKLFDAVVKDVKKRIPDTP